VVPPADCECMLRRGSCRLHALLRLHRHSSESEG
jgi:hypothetical protein